jgi:opacity protein-like surface antigen
MILSLQRLSSLAVVFVVISSSAWAQDESGVYVRASFGYDLSRDVRLVDRACDPAPLLNFFGCQPGTDGIQIGAPGDVGGGPAVEVAAGVRVLPFLRAELAIAHRPDLDFEGNATFPGAGNAQPVSASVTGSSVMARVFADLASLLPLAWAAPIEPFVGAGVGASRNRMGDVLYEFPELASQPATTMTGGGAHWDGAWDASVGAAVRVGRRTLVEGAYRYSDFGWIETDAGTIDVVRGSRVFAIDNVAGTRGRLSSHGVYLGIRQEF